MAKFLVVKKVVSEESWCLLVDSEHSLDELQLLTEDGEGGGLRRVRLHASVRHLRYRNLRSTACRPE